MIQTPGTLNFAEFDAVRRLAEAFRDDSRLRTSRVDFFLKELGDAIEELMAEVRP